MRLAVTGHRPDKLGGFSPFNPIKTRVVVAARAYLLRLYEANPDDLVVYTGMALGVDQWVAQICLDLHISYIACVPHDGQESIWRKDAQEYYQFLRRHAKSVIVVSPGPYKPWKMQRRNEYMVDNGDRLLAVWNGSSGGTANCVRYAFEKERVVDRLDW